jgi:hypothetical protein
MDGGIDLGKGCFEKLQSLVVSSSESTVSLKVAEEMLLCEVSSAYAETLESICL